MSEVLEVKIGYVNPKFDIREDRGPLRDAVEWASHGLAMRHRIRLEGPYYNDGDTYVRLSGIEFDDNFNAGRHLRGISGYLMKNPYIKQFYYRKGKGLLYFIPRRKAHAD